MITKQKHWKRSIWVTFIMAIAMACYPGDSIPLDDLDTTSTFYVTTDFETKPTSVAFVWDVAQIEDEEADNDLPYAGAADPTILNKTLDNLIATYGQNNIIVISDSLPSVPLPDRVDVYFPGDTIPAVDMVMTPSIVLKEKTVGVVYPGYPWWGGGWWGWYPGYPCYYCGYPPTVGYYTYEQGTVLLNMYDVRNQGPEDPPALFDSSWAAVFRGLISSNREFNLDRISKGIDQAFSQSPYLAD